MLLGLINHTYYACSFDDVLAGLPIEHNCEIFHTYLLYYN